MILSRLRGTFNTYLQIGLKTAAIYIYGLADRLNIKKASGDFGSLGANSVYLHNAADTTNYLELKSGVNAAPLTLTLPIADGSNGHVLTTNGSGATSFQTTGLPDVLAGNTGFTHLNLGAESTLTVSSGAITVTQIRHAINNNSGNVTINTISGSTTNGRIVILHSTHISNTVTFTTAGNIAATASGSFTYQRVLRYSGEYIAYIYSTGDSKWHELTPRLFDLKQYVTDSVGSVTPYSGLAFPSRLISNTATLTPTINALGNYNTSNWFAARAANNATVGIGIAAPTGTGAVVASPGGANGNGPFVQYTSVATAGNFAGVVTTSFNVLASTGEPTFFCVFEPGATVTNARFWCGIGTANPAYVDSPALGYQGAGLRFSTVAGDTSIQTFAQDAGNSIALASTGIAFTGNETYTFTMQFSGSTIYYRLYSAPAGGTTYTGSMANPGISTQSLGVFCVLYTTTTVAKVLKFSRFMVETN